MFVNASIHDVFSPYRKKDSTWDEYAFAKFEEFKKWHADEIVEHGVDNLTTEEAYALIFRKSSSYIMARELDHDILTTENMMRRLMMNDILN